MKLKKKILSAVLAGGILFNAGGALADTADGLMKFKEAYLAEVVNNRAFAVNADFFSPSYHAELNGLATILRDATMRMNGKINWEFTNPTNNQVLNENIPYYIEQNGDTMTMFVQRKGNWSKFTLPAIPVGVANAIKTTNITTLQQNMTAVKSVDVLKDDADQRIMNVTLDGKKLAELLHAYNDANIAKLSQAEQAAQKSFIDHLADALQTTDLTCAWTVNKKNWNTVSATIDLTKLIQAYGKDYLNDAANGDFVLSAEDRSFYEVLGYYTELHFVATDTDFGNETLTQPQGVNSARTNANALSDLVTQIANSKK